MGLKLAIGICLSASLLFNSSFAEEAILSAEKAPSTDKAQKKEPSAEKVPSVEKVPTPNKAQSAEKAPSTDKAQKKEPSADKAPASGKRFETTIDNYMKAWKKQDFKTMRDYESWEGGAELGEVKYIQSFDADFRVYNWNIIKKEAIGNDEYKVWLLMDYNPPKQVASFLPPGKKTVRGTRIQYWKKQGDKFVHLFHIERKRFMELLFPKQPQPPQASPLPPAQGK